MVLDRLVDADKRGATHLDVMSFFVWHKLETSPLREYETPIHVKRWFVEFHSKSLLEWHEFFYDKYPNYAEMFCEKIELG